MVGREESLRVAIAWIWCRHRGRCFGVTCLDLALGGKGQGNLAGGVTVAVPAFVQLVLVTGLARC